MRQADKSVRTVKSEISLGDGKVNRQILDLEHLSHYTLGDTALAIEILQLFTAQSDVYLNGLQSAQDGIDWHQVVHGLKGSARAIGAWALADLAEKAEQGHLSDVDRTRREFLPGLRDQVERTKAQISAVLAENKAA